MKLQIRFFAILREQAGRSSVDLETRAATPAALYTELRAQFPGLIVPFEMLRVSINERYAGADDTLQSGDRIVFIPPVAGG